MAREIDVPYGFRPVEPIDADVLVEEDWSGVAVGLRWAVLQHLFPVVDNEDQPELGLALLVGNDGQALLMASPAGTKGRRFGGQHGLRGFDPQGAKFEFGDLRLPGYERGRGRCWRVDQPRLSWAGGQPVAFLPLGLKDAPDDTAPPARPASAPGSLPVVRPAQVRRFLRVTATLLVNTVFYALTLVSGAAGALVVIGTILFLWMGDTGRHSVLADISAGISRLADRYPPPDIAGFNPDSLPAGTALTPAPTASAYGAAGAAPRKVGKKPGGQPYEVKSPE